jgi:ribosomal protein S18 acetylase RimI-like enzyme
MNVEGPFVSVVGLDELRPLWEDLLRHHLAVAAYRELVDDPQRSWERRQSWYHELLEHGGAYFVARDERERLLGYAMTQTVLGPDDTFEVRGGIVEVITLVVAESSRAHGIGSALLATVREFAARQGIDTLKVAVMLGNIRAQSFYANAGFEPAEEVRYAKLEDGASD